MYHYKDCGLSYIYLTNGFNVEEIDGEEYVSIDNLYDLHTLIGQNIISQVRAITSEEFKFLRIELNMSQKSLGHLLGVDTQTVARWEKGQTAIPRTADVTLRALYAESNGSDSQIGLMLNILSDAEIDYQMKDLHLKEQEEKWQIAEAG
ncbi:helix-turn-helix domain-containing protein [Gayadomonas joobiniege]|uniref:helix-turn-helix domain-containing protein n=1 Tax=Gayadomonas joobiniege TaxID=1234606 RepID=UPI00037621A5|nr:helix-turn-helix domain-containing protein [Gayadomonas joobiniege]